MLIFKINLVKHKKNWNSYIKQHYNFIDFFHDMAWEQVVNRILWV